MKVLHLIPKTQRRGAEVFASELFVSLAEKGIQGKIASLFRSEAQLGLAPVAKASCLSSNGSSLGILHALREEIRSYSPDIVLAHGGEPLKFAILSTLFLRQSPPIVYRKIGLSNQWFRKLRFVKLPFYRWLVSRAAFIISVCSSVTAELEDLFRVPGRKIRNIANATDPKRFELPENARRGVRESLGIADGAQVIINVGALSWEKNQLLIIKAFSEVRKSFPDMVLLLVGTGPEESNLRRITESLKLNAFVRFIGLRSDVPELLSASDIFVLTSLTEGVPGVLIEAGLAGLPAATWDVGGVREVVQHETTGIVTPYKDENAFLEAVRMLAADKASRARMGKAAREFCMERFDIKRCAGEHIRLFEEILSKSNR